MEKESAHARGVGVDASDVERLSKKPEKLEKAPLEPATPDAATAAATMKNKPLEEKTRDDEEGGSSSSRPRFWTRSSSSRLNQPVEGEGLDLEAERRLHLAHERHETVPAASAVCSPGSGVAAAMARLGRESLSMAD